MGSQIDEKADVVRAGDGSIVAVGDPGIESRLCQSATESARAGAQLLVRDRRSRRDAPDATRRWLLGPLGEV
jgi:hypothetical protein